MLRVHGSIKCRIHDRVQGIVYATPIPHSCQSTIRRLRQWVKALFEVLQEVPQVVLIDVMAENRPSAYTREFIP